MFISFPKRRYFPNFLWVTGKPFFLVHHHVDENWVWDILSGNTLKICLYCISSLPSVSTSTIFQPLLGASSQVWDSAPSNLPTLSKLSLFYKTVPSSHNYNSSVRINLSILWYIVVLFNFPFPCSISGWMWVPKCLWFIFGWQLGCASQYLNTPHWSQTPFLFEHLLSHTPFSGGLLILIIYILSQIDNTKEYEQSTRERCMRQ